MKRFKRRRVFAQGIKIHIQIAFDLDNLRIDPVQCKLSSQNDILPNNSILLDAIL